MPISCPASATIRVSSGNVSIEWPGMNQVVLSSCLLEQIEQPRGADLAGEEPARDVVRRVLAAVGAEPAGDGVDVDAVGAENLLGHRFLLLFDGT